MHAFLPPAFVPVTCIHETATYTTAPRRAADRTTNAMESPSGASSWKSGSAVPACAQVSGRHAQQQARGGRRAFAPEREATQAIARDHEAWATGGALGVEERSGRRLSDLGHSR